MFLATGAVNKDVKKSKKKKSDNHGNNIVGLADVVLNFLFKISETKGQRRCIRVASRVAKRLKN